MATDVTPDDELMERLRSLAGSTDPVPDDVILAGRSAIAHRDLDLRLAELVDEELAAGVRGEEEPWFTFEVDDVVIELAVRQRRGQRTLVGQLDGATASDVVINHAAEQDRCDIDDLGRFSAPISSGPLRVQVTLESGERIATSWLVSH